MLKVDSRSTEELLKELKRLEKLLQNWNEELTVLARKAATSRIRAADLEERGQAATELGGLIGQLRALIAARYVEEFENAKQQHKPAGIGLSHEQIESYIQQGIAACDQYNFHLAVDAFNTILYSDTKNALAYYYRGLTFFRMAGYRQAMLDFTESIHANPEFSDSYLYRAKAYRNWGKPEDAIKDLDEAIRLSPQNVDAYRQRGFLLYERKQYQAALVDLTETIRLNSTDAEAYYFRAGVYMALGDYEKALADCETALKHRPEYWAAKQFLNEIHAKIANDA